MEGSRPVADRVPTLAYGDRVVSGFLPVRIVSEGRLVPLRTPEGMPEIPDVEGALLRAVEVSSTPELLPSLKDLLASAYRGGDVAVIVDDYTRPASTKGSSSRACSAGSSTTA